MPTANLRDSGRAPHLARQEREPRPGWIFVKWGTDGAMKRSPALPRPRAGRPEPAAERAALKLDAFEHTDDYVRKAVDAGPAERRPRTTMSAAPAWTAMLSTAATERARGRRKHGWCTRPGYDGVFHDALPATPASRRASSNAIDGTVTVSWSIQRAASSTRTGATAR